MVTKLGTQKRIISVFDFDGCTVNDFHRRKYLPFKKMEKGTASGKDFAKYHSRITEDTFFDLGVEVLHKAILAGHTIFFVTARPECAYQDTVDQILTMCGLQPSQYKLYMRLTREEGIHSVELKETKIKEIMSAYPDSTIYGYDDRADVVKMYHDNSINAYLLHGHEFNDGETYEVLVGYKNNNIFVNNYGRPHVDHTLIIPAFFTKSMNKAIAFDHLMPNHHKGVCNYFLMDHSESFRGNGLTTIIGGVAQGATSGCKTEINPLLLFGDQLQSEPSTNCRCTVTQLKGYECDGDFKHHFVSKVKEMEDSIKPEWHTPQLEMVMEILSGAADTFKERHKVYGDNSKVVGQCLAALFPGGPKLDTPESHELYMFVMHIVGKLSRFAASNMTHRDSIHDIITYAALAESKVIEGVSDEQANID